MRSNRLATALLAIWAAGTVGCAASGRVTDAYGELGSGGSLRAADEPEEAPTQFAASAWRGFGGAAATATLEYSIPGAGHVRVVVYDVAGREAGRVVDSWRPAGKYVVDFNYGAGRRQVQSYRIEWEGQSLSGRIALGQ